MQTETPGQTTAERDMSERWRPTDQQITVARAMLAAEPAADAVFVGIALPGKERGVWDYGQAVRPVPGFWLAARGEQTGPLAYALARDAADDAAGRRLTRRGASSYATIDRDGGFAVFEGMHTSPV